MQNFEENLKKLQAIINELEANEVPLEKAIKTFQTGMELINNCQTSLNQAEQTIKQLTQDNQLEPITTDETTEK